jgi:uncharacterized protein involved in exopolysaccharide biosynthesis
MAQLDNTKLELSVAEELAVDRLAAKRRLFFERETRLAMDDLAAAEIALKTFIVQQLDKAARPEKRSSPRRALIVVTSTMLALFIAVLAAFFMEKLDQARKDPQFAAKRL